MKTQNTNKLDFTRNSIVELNDESLNDVRGGSTIVLTTAVCIIAAGSIVLAVYLANKD